MHGAIILAAAIATAGAPVADAPAGPRATAGSWRLTEVNGKVGCTVNLTDHTAAGALPGGLDVKFPSVCRRAFPVLKDLATWSVDPQGAVVFSDAKGQRIVALAGSPGGPYEAKTANGAILHLEAARAAPSPAAATTIRMSGAFRLTGSSGAALCDLVLHPDIFGASGWITPESCATGWADKGFAVWTLRQGRLTLMDKARKPILILKAGDTGVFVNVESKTDPITLVRKTPGGLGLRIDEAVRRRQAWQRYPLA